MKTNWYFSILTYLALTAGSMPVLAEGVGGDETNVDRTVIDGSWTVLVAEPILIMEGPTHCVATGSADARNPDSGDDNRYRFALSIDNANPPLDGACERSVEFDQNDHNNGQLVEEVSSTCTFRNLNQGMHTIYWLARKQPLVGGGPDMTVADNSLTFVCHKRLMDMDGEGDGNGGGN